MSPLQIIRFRTLVLQILREMKILILQIRPHRVQKRRYLGAVYGFEKLKNSTEK